MRKNIFSPFLKSLINLSFILGSVFRVLSTKAMSPADLDRVLGLPEWSDYVSAVQHYQGISPGVFTPLELLRVDLLEFKSFQEQVKSVGAQWKVLDSQGRAKSALDQKESLSRTANDWLLRQFRKEKVALQGSHLGVLKAMKETQRVAMTPLDAVFQNTEIGKKISTDLKSRSEFELRSVKFVKSKSALVFEGIPVAWKKNSRLAPMPIYQMAASVVDGGNFVKLRAQFVDKAEASYPDLKFRKEFLSGSFFDPQSSSRYLLGPLPSKANVFIDEGGTTHFSGDGHKH